MKIDKIQDQHVEQIVDIFDEELNVSILNLFGKEFIEKMFKSLLVSNLGFVSISDETFKVTGFIIMIKKDISLFRCITFKSLINFFTKILTNYSNLKAFLISFFKLYLLRNNIKNNDDTAVELSHFAVKDAYKGRGVGSQLVKKLEEQAKTDGYLRVFTSSHNQRLVDYYLLKKKARILRIVDIGIYKSHNIMWDIN